MHVKIAKKTISAVFFAALFVFLPSIFQVVSENTMQWWLTQQPQESFFEYHSERSQKTTYTKEEELKMISILDVKEPLDFVWNDILRCNFDNDVDSFSYVSVMISSAQNAKIADDKVSPWVYEGRKPQTPATCFIESNINADVGYGVHKKQKIQSNEFRIE